MTQAQRFESGFYTAGQGDITELAALVGAELSVADAPSAAEIAKNIPIYDMRALSGALVDPTARRKLLSEWATVLGGSAGALVLRGAYPSTEVIDAATDRYLAMIAEAKEGGADHFAAAGANDRIWNALQKLCDADPEVFALYFGNEAIAAAAEAWLGPNYQMTAQINLVRPGGAPQEAHRDYHLGFQTAEIAAQYPTHIHALSAALTLQGAVAHCDMPIESGPTKLLPFSQLFAPGYVEMRRGEVRALFEEKCVQLPLAKGDALFFNPALLHGAGANHSSDIQRMANLLQVSSAFGRAMESVDRRAMSKRLYPAMQSLISAGRLAPPQVDAAIAACAEGYSFPTNLDTDPPVGGLAPETQAALFARALREGLSASAFSQELDKQSARRAA